MTELNAAVTGVLADVARIGAEIAALAEEAKRKRTEAMQPLLDALAASGTVSMIVVRGYTPSFNDGEPCEHSYDYWANMQQIAADEVLGYGLNGFDDEAFEWLEELGTPTRWNNEKRQTEDIPGVAEKNREICAEHGHIYDAPPADIQAAISNVIAATDDENEGTDYWVVYTLQDGKFVRESGEYDCGY